MPKGLYRNRSFLSIRHAHGDLCKHLGIDPSTDLNDRYSNLFLNAYIYRHAHTECLKMIEVYSVFGIWHVFYIVLTPISTTSGLWSTGNTRKYHLIDVYIYQCVRLAQSANDG